MKRVVLILSLLLIYSNLIIAQSEKLKTFINYVEKSYSTWDIPGFAVAVVENGKIVFERGFGYLSWEKKHKANEFTIYPIGSISKSFTALALAQLVEQGKIKWTDPVRKYVPELKLYDDFVSEHVNIEDLLCHRVGYKTFSGDLLWYRTNYSYEQLLEKLQYLKPVFDFRDGFGYSNMMFLVAGIVIERVSGITWEEYVKKNIFQPLEMNRTNTDVALQKTDDNFAPGCMIGLNGEKLYMPYIPSHNIGPFGGINSSVHDLANYMIMLMNNGEFNGKRLISPAQIDYMWQVHNPLPVGKSAKKLYPTRHFYGYGLGWFVYDNNGYKIVTHSGGMDGALAKLVMIPDLNVGMVVLTNSNSQIYRELADYFVALYTDEKSDIDWNQYYHQRFNSIQQAYVNMKNRYKRIPNTEPSLKLSDYQGVYHSEAYGDIEVKLVDGKLELYFKPAPYLNAELTHFHYDVFEIHFKNTLMAIPTQWGLAHFIMDENGNIVKLKLNVPNFDFWFDEFEFQKLK